MAVIYPGPGQEAETARQLLTMTDNPYDVKVTTDTVPGTGRIAFIVPDELAERYNNPEHHADGDAEPVMPRRRGRPAKKTTGTVEE